MIEDFSHYCFDGGPFVLIDCIMWLFFAATLVLRGVWEDAYGPFAKRRERYEREQLTKELRLWHVAANGYEAAAMLPSVRAAWHRLHAPALVGAGIGVLAGLCLFALASGALTGSLLLLSAFVNIPDYACGFFFGSIGYAVGLAYGAYQVRREHKGRPQYAGVSPRRLSSYRSRRVPLLLSAVVLVNIAATVAEAPHIAPQLHISVAGGAQYLVPTSPILVAMPLVGMVLIIGLMEALAAQTASLPGFVSGLPVAQAIQVDDILRTRGVMAIEAAEMVVVAELTLADMFLTAWGFGDVHSAPVFLLGVVLFYVAMFLGMIGVVRLTGGQSVAGLTDWLFAPRNARWRTHSSS